MSTVDLSARARHLLKVLVECYIAEGEPLGSKTLAARSGVRVSSATVRNVMVELESIGLVSSPHTSAGRVPTVEAFRYFVDHLLDPAPVDVNWQEKVRQCFSDCQSDREVIRAVGHVLAELTQVAGLVTLQGCNSAMLRKVEFLPQANDGVLVLLVTADAQVSHSVVTLVEPLQGGELEAAEGWAREHLSGLSLLTVSGTVNAMMGEADDSLGVYSLAPEALLAARLVRGCFAATHRGGDFVIAGQANLLSRIEGQDLARLEQLYRVLEVRQDILPPLPDGVDAASVRVLMGSEAAQFGGSFSVITSAYSDAQALRGRLALVGPLRMEYAQLVPFVGWVAKILGSALKEAQ